MKKIFIVFILFIACNCYSQVIDDNNDIDYEIASVSDIINNPDFFLGKKVAVEGFLILECEGSALYETEDGYKDICFTTKNYLNIAIRVRTKKRFFKKNGVDYNSYSKKDVAIYGIIEECDCIFHNSAILVNDIKLNE